MYLLLDHNNVTLHISPTIGYQENGNPLVDNGTLAYAAILVDKVVEIDEIPEGITPMRWCYIDGEFVPNPNWVEPELPEEPIDVDRIIGILRGEIE